jgi:hypothetical protein
MCSAYSAVRPRVATARLDGSPGANSSLGTWSTPSDHDDDHLLSDLPPIGDVLGGLMVIAWILIAWMVML